jgi:hypothetical protein
VTTCWQHVLRSSDLSVKRAGDRSDGLPPLCTVSRVLRACTEPADKNPITSTHDQGAGGNGNVLKEIVEPLGAAYDSARSHAATPRSPPWNSGAPSTRRVTAS